VSRFAKRSLALLVFAVFLAAVTGALADSPPSASIDPASSVSYASAHLSGEVNPHGGPSATLWSLEYSTTGEEGSWTAAGSGEFTGAEAEETNPIAVAADATGLAPNTTYFIRIVASNEGGGNRRIVNGPSFTTLAVATPTVTIEEPAGVTSTSAQLSGHVNPNADEPEGSTSPAEEEAFRTSWRFECTPGCPGVEGTLEADDTSHEVSGEVHLHPGVHYEVRLVASNAGGEAGSETKSIEPPAVGPTVVVKSTEVSSFETDSAQIQAKIRPGGTPATYHFEYVSASQFEESEFTDAASTPESASIGSDNEEHLVTATVSGLQPGKTYFARVVATNIAGTAIGAPVVFTTINPATIQSGCPNAQLRSESGSTLLPDCRAYELVSPEHQGFPTAAGPNPITNNRGVWVAATGNRVAYPSIDPFTGESGAEGTYSAERTDTGWVNHALFPPRFVGNAIFPPLSEALSDDGTRIVVATVSPLLPEEEDGFSLDVYLIAGGSTTLVSAGTAEDAYYLGRSSDAKQIFFETRSNLTPEASGSQVKVYEWDEGTIRLVSLVPPPGEAACGGSGEANCTATELGAIGGRHEASQDATIVTPHAVSPDGSLAVFTSPEPANRTPGNPSEVYVRINGARTVEASASQCTRSDCNESSAAVYEGSTADGEIIFFSTTQQLTNDDTDEARDLYSYDVDTQTLTRISAGTGISDPPNGEASRLLGSSNDGTRVFFMNRDIPSGLEFYNAGTLTEVGKTELVSQSETCTAGGGASLPEVTPDGQIIVFQAEYPFEPAISNSPSGKGLFRYDARDGSLIRIAGEGASLPTSGPGGGAECSLRRGLSDDGNAVFFSTSQALVPSDVNETVDTYEWHDGSVSLISAGTGGQVSGVLGSSSDGSDVFFITGDPLVAADQDKVQDVYDARIDGGYPAPARPPVCSGEACHGAPTAAPAALSAATATFVGPVNHRSHRAKHKHRRRKHRKRSSGHRSNRNVSRHRGSTR